MRRAALAPGFLALALLSSGCRERFDSREAEKSHQAQEQQVAQMWFDDTGARLFVRTAGIVRVWDVASGTVEKRVGPGMTGAGVSGGNVEVAPDLSGMAVFRGNNKGGTLSVYDEDLDTPSWTTTTGRGVSVVGLGAGGSVVAVSGTRFFNPGAAPQAPRLLVFRSGEPLPVLEVELDKNGWAWVAPDGGRAAFLRGKDKVVLLDLETLSETCEIPVREMRGMLFSADSTSLAILEKRALRFADPSTGRETASVDIGATQLQLLSFPGDLLAATFLSDAVYRYSTSGALRWSWSIRGQPGQPAQRIWKFGVAANADTIAFSLDNDLRVIDPGTGRWRVLCRKPCYGPNTNLIEAIATSPDGQTTAVAAGRSLTLWSTDGSPGPRKLADPDLQ